MLYDRPICDLVAEATSELTEPMTFTDVLDWIVVKYPRVKESSIRAHVIGMTANSASRKHYPSLARRSPIFFQIGKGEYVRYKNLDPERILSVEGVEEFYGDSMLEIEESISNVEKADSMEFALEAYLEEFIITNWDAIDWGRPLQIWIGADGRTGHQLTTPVGRIDILAYDESSQEFVVIELKRGRSSDQVVGQAARYLGWVLEHMAASDQVVSAIVIASGFDQKLHYSVSAVPNLSVLAYEVNFSLHSPNIRLIN